MRARCVVILAVAVLLAKGTYGQKPGCSNAKAMRALDQADQLRTWDALYRSYKTYRLCDDGAIAEGYSDSVARILSDHWSTLPRFASLAEEDAGFRKFVLRHIDATNNTEDLEVVEKNANGKCPTGLSALCGDISKRAREALADEATLPH